MWMDLLPGSKLYRTLTWITINWFEQGCSSLRQSESVGLVQYLCRIYSIFKDSRQSRKNTMKNLLNWNPHFPRLSFCQSLLYIWFHRPLWVLQSNISAHRGLLNQSYLIALYPAIMSHFIIGYYSFGYSWRHSSIKNRCCLSHLTKGCFSCWHKFPFISEAFLWLDLNRPAPATTCSSKNWTKERNESHF